MSCSYSNLRRLKLRFVFFASNSTKYANTTHRVILLCDIESTSVRINLISHVHIHTFDFSKPLGSAGDLGHCLLATVQHKKEAVVIQCSFRTMWHIKLSLVMGCEVQHSERRLIFRLIETKYQYFLPIFIRKELFIGKIGHFDFVYSLICFNVPQFDSPAAHKVCEMVALSDNAPDLGRGVEVRHVFEFSLLIRIVQMHLEK